ncbi:MAG: nickel pincer cofactor biosynthesis protein LarC, partial [Isosphaeraceae bacterium]
VRRGEFRAIHAKVTAPHEHAHRHLHQIEAIIDRSTLTPKQNDLAKRIFRRLGEAEASAHGVDIQKIHFHEVGAVDSIIDIVGAAVGLDLLNVDRIEASPVPPGRGWVRAAHGKMPLPAPGTAELLKGIPLAESTADMEQTTPTGAAILATVADSFGPLPPMTISAIGHGAGTRELPDQANMLRLFLGQTADASTGSDRVWMLETNLDDLTGEIVGYTLGQLLAAGALDAFLTPIQMKKNRPGVMVSALCVEADIPALEAILFRETTTLGIRRYPVSRHKLRREAATVDTPEFGPVQGKLGWLEGRPPSFRPEFDDCARIASERGVSLRTVYQAASEAALAHSPGPTSTAPSADPRTQETRYDPSHEHDHPHPH